MIQKVIDSFKNLLKNPTPLMTVVVVNACTFRFLVDGISFTAFGHPITLPHTDPSSYISILTPILGAHGYLHGKTMDKGQDL